MGSSIEDKKVFAFKDLMYWSSITFTISGVAALNYVLLFYLNGAEITSLSGVLMMYLGLVLLLVFTSIVYSSDLSYKKPAGKYIIFIVLSSPVSLLLKEFLDVNYLKCLIPYFVLMPLLIMLVILFYKNVLSSMFRMTVCILILSVLFSILLPDGYDTTIGYFIITVYLEIILYAVYCRGAEEKEKTPENGLYIILKGLVWPFFGAKNLYLSNL